MMMLIDFLNLQLVNGLIHSKATYFMFCEIQISIYAYSLIRDWLS